MVFFSDGRPLPPFPQNPARRAKGAFWHSRPYESTASPPVTLVQDDEGKMSVSGKPKHSLDVDRKHDAFEQKYGESAGGNENDGLRDLVRHTMFEKGQSKRILGELYKVVDSSDVIVQIHKVKVLPFGETSERALQAQAYGLSFEHDLIASCCVIWFQLGQQTKGWLRVLSKEYPTLAFHSSINKSFGKVQVTNLADASEHIGEVLRRVKKEHLQRAYKIKDWEDENDFLVQLCRATGKLLRVHLYLLILLFWPDASLAPLLRTLEYVSLVILNTSISGGEPDLTTAAKMVLHDWQRGKIPFFVPPQEAEASQEPSIAPEDADKDSPDVSNQVAAAFRAIANVISSQQQKSVPVARDLYTEEGLKGESSSKLGLSKDKIGEDNSTKEEDEEEGDS